MGQRLKKQEVESRSVSKIIHRIMQLEKHYEPRLVERACSKYKMAMSGKRKAMKEKQILEERLSQINKKLK